MAELHYEKMARMLTRCAEIADAPNVKATVKTTYAGILEAPAIAYLDAHRAVIKAESKYAQEVKEANEAMAQFDQPYREARSVVKAFVPTVKVPVTLKQLTTDTDRLNAIDTLIDIVDDHETMAWAMEILTGAFGQRAQPTITEVNEAIEASKTLDEARKKRAMAFEPAYQAYVRFKRVVRDAMGAKSIEYKRIHPRGGPSNDAEAAPPSAP